MDIRFAEAGDRNRLIELYDACFPGEHEYAEYFFDSFWKPERTLTAIEDGSIVSMVHMLKTSMKRDGKRMDAMYIYAAATFQEYRGRGIMGKLLKRAEELAIEWGEHLILLITENESLFKFYKRFGYEPSFCV